MRVVAIRATHSAFEYPMVVRKVKFRADFQMTLKTGFRILAGIDDRVRRTTGLDVQTAGAVA